LLEGKSVDKQKFDFIWETAAIFFALFALLFWRFNQTLTALRWGLLLVAFALMILVAYRRIGRLRRMKDEQDQSGPSGPPFSPFPPGQLP
jgi:hypothetical protein